MQGGDAPSDYSIAVQENSRSSGSNSIAFSGGTTNNTSSIAG